MNILDARSTRGIYGSSPMVLHAKAWLVAVLTASIPLASIAHDHHPAVAAGDRVRQEQTIEFWQQRLLQRPDSTINLSNLGRIYLNQARRSGNHRDYVSTEHYFRRLLAVDHASFTGMIGLAYALAGQHRLNEALQAAREAATLGRDRHTVLAMLGDIHLAMGHLYEAELAYRSLHAAQPDMSSYVRLASLAEERGRIDEALALTNVGCAAAQEREVAAHQLSWCRLRLAELNLLAGHADDAEMLMHQAISLDRGNHAAQWRLGELQLRLGRPVAAERTVRRLVNDQPRPKYWITLGDILLSQGREDEARELFDRAEQRMVSDLEQGDIGHIQELAEFWLSGRLQPNGRTQWNDALTLAQRDVAEIRQDSGAYTTLSWALHKLNRRDEAVAAMGLALRSGMRHPELVWRAGLVFSHADRPNAARRLLEEALQTPLGLQADQIVAAEEILAALPHFQLADIVAPRAAAIDTRF